MAQPSWEQERAVSAPAVRPVGVLADGWTGSCEPYKPPNGEVGESGAGVGAARTTDETGQCPWREGAALGLRTRGR